MPNLYVKPLRGLPAHAALLFTTWLARAGAALLLLALLPLAAGAQALLASAGGTHTLSIHPDGTLWAWGNNASGQLGDNTTTQRAAPVQVGTATNWASVSGGSSYSLGVRTDGTLWA
jgi:alpha-tubulin suppressor-like RCC1 family protein